jgi:UDP-2,4-diacetamido-2,4,6-trideoxy-beta-L-altropyranose hydrolase
LNQEYDIGIRVEMGNNVGYGHFFRCLALAEEFIKKRRKVIFITNSKNIKKHLKKNIPFFILKGKMESDRIKECKKISKKIKFWIFDLPKENKRYSFHFKKHNSAIIDDLGNIDVYSKLLINGGIVKKFQKYNHNNKTKFLIGPKYMILRKNFYKNRLDDRVCKKKIGKILLTFGGTDDSDLSSKILSEINTKKYQVSVLLGPTYKFSKKIQTITNSNKNIKIISNSKDTSTLFRKFDLVLATPGITIYELACLGIPTILISINEIQHTVAKYFHKMKIGINYGFWKEDMLKLEKMIESLEEEEIRNNMKKTSQKIIDGKGIFRVSNIIDDFLKKSI